MKDSLFKENGFFSEAGQSFVTDYGFEFSIESILKSFQVQDMSVAELQTLKCNLAKILGDKLSDAITSKTNGTVDSDTE